MTAKRLRKWHTQKKLNTETLRSQTAQTALYGLSHISISHTVSHLTQQVFTKNLHKEKMPSTHLGLTSF